jgi:hypothetical protein
MTDLVFPPSGALEIRGGDLAGGAVSSDYLDDERGLSAVVPCRPERVTLR